jgi:hypothetical protein
MSTTAERAQTQISRRPAMPNEPALTPPVDAADIITTVRRATMRGASPRQLARIAGALYLVNVLAGAFAIGYVQTTLFAVDPATTAANIQSHQFLYRSGLAAHVVVTVTNVPLALIFRRTMTFHPTVQAFEPGTLLRWRGRLALPSLFDGEHELRVESTGPET